MKKIILITSLVLGCFVGYSQSTVTTMTGSADTLVDATPDYVTIAPQLFYDQVSFQAKVTKISGTVAGYALIQGSNDGTNYKDLNTDTLTLTNVTTNTKIWAFAYNNFAYYRIAYVGTGTMSAKIYGYCLTTGGNGKHAVSNMLQAFGSASDTVTNSATGYVELQIRNSYKTVSVHAVVTKISGTVGGTVTLQGSNDGTNYVTVSSSFSDAQTLAALNQTTTHKLFTITGCPYRYVRLSYTGTGTMSATIKGYLLPNK